MPTPTPALPNAFVERLARIVPENVFDSVLASFSAPKRAGFRVNTLFAEAEQILSELDVPFEALPGCADAFTVAPEHRQTMLDSGWHQRGELYAQNPSSMIPPLVLAPEPGERVLDLCAAPGSKTSQIAALMDNDGELAAVEVVKNRYYKLRDNLDRLGVECARVFNRDGTLVWRHRPEYFDRVLLDAPCSSEGRFHTDNPDSWRYWSQKKIKEMTRKQKQLIWSGIHCLRPGGILVYSTCSMAPEENEGVIQHALKKFGDAIEIEPLKLSHSNVQPGIAAWTNKPFDPAVRNSGRVLPDETMEAFFICKIRKR